MTHLDLQFYVGLVNQDDHLPKSGLMRYNQVILPGTPWEKTIYEWWEEGDDRES